MFIKQQQLLSLKEENVKFTKNFNKFLKKHEANKKFISKNHIKDFMEEQKTLMGTINQRIDEIIAKDQTTDRLHQTRKRSENETRKASKKHCKESVEVTLNYSGRYFAFFKFCKMRNSNHNILREICEIAKSKLPIEYHFENIKT